MNRTNDIKLSVLVPMFNEAAGLSDFHASLIQVLHAHELDSYEVLYCDDGSTDDGASLVRTWHKDDERIKLLQLSRNFGKEGALAALIGAATGKALIMLDADGQHPVELIPEFVKKWEDGAQVVIGITKPYKREGIFKRLGSKLFYRLFNRLAPQKLIPGSSDFRLIDSEVQEVFMGLNESDRITRGLIDWIGFERVYIPYTTKPRAQGTASYSRRKLFGLAMHSFVSMTPTPLYMFGYLGVLITALSFVLGIAVIIEQLILEDPLSWNFTGNAMLGIMLLFLVGIVLMSQGILSLYVSSMHRQSKQRPLYVVNHAKSAGINKKQD